MKVPFSPNMNGHSFGLHQLPFAAVPDTEAYFSTQQMEAACQSIERTARCGDGISLIVGASGVGKTLLLRLLRKKLESEFTVVYISNGKLNCPKDFLRQLSFELRLPTASSSEDDELQYRFALMEFAQQEITQGIVVLIDEAQYLDSSVLEEIRLLMNTDDGVKPFFRAVLAGTIELEEKLTLARLAPFDQRIAARIYLDTLTLDETIGYIDWQTARVAGSHVADTAVPRTGAATIALKEYIALSGSIGNDNSTDCIAESTDDIDENECSGEILRFDSTHCIQSKTGGAVFTTVFTDEAKRLVHRYSEGLPRLVNHICRSAMELAPETEQIDGQIDGQIIQTAWNTIQCVRDETIAEAKPAAPLVSVCNEDVCSEAAIEQKKSTLQLKQFDSVIEFGVLEDETAEPNCAESSCAEPNCETQEERQEIPEQYKPPYPMDFEEEAEEEFDITQSYLFRKPKRKKNYRWDGPRKYQKREPVDNKNKSKPEHVIERFASLSLLCREFSTKTAWAGNVAARSMFCPVHCVSFVSVPSSMLADSSIEDTVENTVENTGSGGIDAETLKKYGEEILGTRPPFVRKEPHYAYQTTDEVQPAAVMLSDWNTPERIEAAGSATIYSEFVERHTELPKTIETLSLEKKDSASDKAQKDKQTQKEKHPEVVRIVLPQQIIEAAAGSVSINEDFDETIDVSGQPIAMPVSAAVKEQIITSQTKCDESAALIVPLPQGGLIQRDTAGEYIITQQVLERVVQRITEAAEIIERAADISKEAGTQITDAADISRESALKFQHTADLVQEEVKAVLPNYKEMFQELSEFQETVSLEMQRIKTDHCRFTEIMQNVKPAAGETNQVLTNQMLPFPKRSGFVPNSESAAKKSVEFRKPE
ncbi:MAG: AAA family ATPase [Planctomycetaceae bacterium]|nr:AAA family ATPase [Planctomycetaceae bacterium]